MPRRLATTSLAIAFAALTAGCGGAASSSQAKPPSIFPSRDDVARIKATPRPKSPFGERVAVVDTWKLTGPAVDTIEDRDREPSAEWEKPLADAVKKRGGEIVVSEAHTCVAREIAAIVASAGAFPATNVRRFITARCGAPSAHVSFNGWTRGVQGNPDEEKLFADAKADVEKLVRDSLPPGPHRVGLWFGRVGDKVGAFIAVAPRRVRLEPMPAVPEDGKVTVRGRLFEPAAYVRGVVNRGAFGYSECKADPTVALPSFVMTCEVSKEDPSAWIEMAAFRPGRIVGNSVVQALVFPAGTPATEYNFRAAEGAAVEPGALPAALLRAINEQRGKAGLAALSFEQAQSRTTADLAPYFFAAAAGSVEETVADKVVLGVRAGWDVLGTVRYGDIASVIAPSASSPAQIMDLALEQPSARAALLAPETNRIAIGPVRSQNDPLVGVLFATYALLDPSTHERDAARVIERIAAKRAAIGLPPPALLGGLERAAKNVSLAVSRGDETPEQGLDDFLQQSVDTLGRGLKAWVFEGTTLDLLEPPKELVEAPSLAFAVAVTHYKPADEPWARLIVYCVVDPQPAGAVLSAGRNGANVRF
jgi:hypothetical protein